MDDNPDAEKAAKDKSKAQAAASQQQTNVHKTDAEKKREERKIARDARKRKIEKLKTKEHLHQGEDKAEKAKITCKFYNKDPEKNRCTGGKDCAFKHA